jgi:crotonobetainyl-CoA:carnitine CoA-transferase CaiB-like acyl-CoA transferase
LPIVQDTPTRLVTYLHGLHVLVVGRGTLSSVSRSVLATLGAEVTLHDGDIAAGEGLDMDDVDGVICDRIASPPDRAYLERVQRWLDEAGPPAGRAWITVSAFGLSGPAKDFRGSEHVCAAAGGLLAAVFDDDGHPHAIPGGQAMQASAHMAALALLYGVSLAGDEGRPVHLDLSAQEAVAFCTNQQTPMNLLNRCAVPAGSSRYSAPSDPFACTDGQVQIIVVDDHQFARFSETIGRPDLTPIFPTLSDRVQFADTINSVCSEWTTVHTKDYCEEVLQAAGVPAAAVRPIGEVVTSPQFRSRGWPDRDGRADGSIVLPALVRRREIAKQGDRRSLTALRVLEFSNVLAGPLAGAILGALGAVVVRVEDADRLDMYRQNGPFVDDIRGPERSAYFQGANYCKRSIRAGSDVVPQARHWADVLLENVGLKRIEQAGVDVAADDESKASLLVSVSAFGRSGPCAGYRGYAQNVHAFAGLEFAVEEAANKLVTLRMVLADYSSAVWAATVCAAWWLGGTVDDERLDLSMAEVVANRIPLPEITRDARDGAGVQAEVDLLVDLDSRYLAVTVSASDWPKLLAPLLGLQATSGHSRNLEDEVIQALRAAAERDLEGTVSRLQQAGIACYPASNPQMLVADPHLAQREFFVALQHPIMGETRIIALPWRVMGRPRSDNYWRAPMLGEHEAWAAQVFEDQA